jgi:arylformamidase
MKRIMPLIVLLLASAAQAQNLKSDIPYADPADKRQVLDIYAPDGAKNLPAIIMTVELRQMVHGLPLPIPGHRGKFGNGPGKHIDFSAVTHVAKGKGIPPFLILHVAGHPDTTAQAKRLGAVLEKAEIPATVFGARETTHNKLNADLGLPDDPATRELFKFLDGK